MAKVTNTPEAASTRADADDVVLRLNHVDKVYGHGETATQRN